MNIIKKMQEAEFEQILFCNDKNSGLIAIIAIHSTKLGPALGGTRIAPYKTEEEALSDVMELAKAMTYKNAVAGLYYGGGKGVIIADPAKDKNEILMRSYGRFVNTLGGRFITGEDVGTNEYDMLAVRRETSYVLGLPQAYGGGGNVSVPTAYGLWQGIKAASAHSFGNDSLKGRKVAVQGVGNVGSALCGHLKKEGAEIFISDIDEEKVKQVAKETGAKAVSNDEIRYLSVDIFSPCALGGILDDNTIAKLKCKIVAGAANNQLVDEIRHAKSLAARNIVYVVDYVVNAGGVISASNELIGYDSSRVFFEVGQIYDRVLKLLDTAQNNKVSTVEAAWIMAKKRFREETLLPNIACSYRPPLCSLPGKNV